MSGDQMPSLPGRKKHQIPSVCTGVDAEASIQLVHYVCKRKSEQSNSEACRKCQVKLEE